MFMFPEHGSLATRLAYRNPTHTCSRINSEFITYTYIFLYIDTVLIVHVVENLKYSLIPKMGVGRGGLEEIAWEKDLK